MKRSILLTIIASAIVTTVAAQGQHRQRFRREAFQTDTPMVHDPVMAKEGDTYYIYSTGMGLQQMTSKDRRTWTVLPQPVMTVIPGWTADSVPGFHGHVWAPDIIQWHGRWWLAYSCSTFGKNGSAIGLLSSRSLALNLWKDEGCIVTSHNWKVDADGKATGDNWNAIDPNFVIDESDTPWLVWGSFWDGIQLARLDTTMHLATKPVTIARRHCPGDPDAAENPTSRFAGRNAIEAPFIFRHGDYYYLFVSWDYCCRGAKSNYRVAVGRSRSVSGPYLDRNGKDMLTGGGTLVIEGDKQEWEAAGHCAVYTFDGEDIFICHGYSASANGAAMLIQRPIHWTADGWPELRAKASDAIRPGQLWPDTDGNHINAHGGGVLLHDGIYYWFGEHKAEHTNAALVGVTCYSSTDLVNWQSRGVALSVSDEKGSDLERGCIVERPKVIYNEKTRKFVMWFHLELRHRGYEAARYGVAVSDKPEGPYTFLYSSRANAGQWPLEFTDEAQSHARQLSMAQYPKWWTPRWTKAVKEGLFVNRDLEGGQMSRDMTLYVDSDGTAYHIFSSEENLTLHIAELTPDYLHHTGRYTRVAPAGHNEAPTLFRHDGTYWLITSGCTGWEPNEARMFSAPTIWGPWTQHPNPCQGPNADKTFGAQGTFVLSLSDSQHIFMADIWRPRHPIDGRYVWLPITFSDGKPVIRWQDEWQPSPAPRAHRGWQVRKDVPLDSIRLSDPAILADRPTMMYYMTGTGGMMWRSHDLKLWEGPFRVTEFDKDSWMGPRPMIWAAELHQTGDGKYYYFATFTNQAVKIDTVRGNIIERRASQVLRADHPMGPYRAFGDDAYLPADRPTLDGTYWKDLDGKPYMVFCGEWLQNWNGTIEKIELKPDLSGTVGEPKVLFRASDSPWSRERNEQGELTWNKVTDGPWLFRTATGRLGMLWTSWVYDVYTQGVAYSESGTLDGPWVQEPDPITPPGYGHSMLFQTFEGQWMMSVHSHRKDAKGRTIRIPHLFEADLSGDKLIIKTR